MKCKKHPKYTGKTKPRCKCGDCMWIHLTAIGVQRLVDIATTMSNILYNIKNDKEVKKDWRHHAAQQQEKWDGAFKDFQEKYYNK